jgi:hypothetical protein
MEDKNKSPQKWWQWVLVYPALATTLIAAIPTYKEFFNSTELNVPYGDSKKAVLQHDMWKKNATCTLAPYEWFKTESNVHVDATICKSGDVLVRVKNPANKGFYDWVPVDRFIETQASLSLLGSAFASELTNRTILAKGSETVLCQRWIDKARLLRRISTPNNGCYDEIVNTYSGYVESKRSAPCNSSC